MTLPAPGPDPTSDEARMPLLEHLRELRKRIRNAVLVLLVTSSIAFAFAEECLALLARPLVVAWNDAKLGTAVLNFGSLTEPFWVQMSVSFYVGIFLASPFIFHQLWKFIAPGLKSGEKLIALPFAIFSALFFCGGAVFCYLLVFPRAFGFFLSYANDNFGHFSGVFGGMLEYQVGPKFQLRPVLMLTEYIDLEIKMLLGFGLVFELPLIVYFLSRVGLVTHRSLWRFNKYWIVIAVIVGAILTPGPDVFSQIMMATPLIVLYELSIVLSYFVTRARERRAAAAE